MGTLGCMRVRLSISGGPNGGGSEPPVDVVIDCPGGTQWAALASQLPAAGCPAHVDGIALRPEMLVGEPPLLHGAAISLGQPPIARPQPRWLLEVVSGPAAGGQFPLPPGTPVVGRGQTADIPLDDPEVSRRHAQLLVTQQGVTVQDAGSANGLMFDGTTLRLGASAARIVDTHALTATGSVFAPDHSGGLVVNVAPRLCPEWGPERIDTPPQPADRPRTPASWIGIVTPALLAVPISLMYGARLLLVTLVTPVAAVIGLVSEHVIRLRRRRAGEAAWHRDRQKADVAIERTLAAERDQRSADAPDVAAVLAMARREQPGLWQRQADDPDFLVLRLGVADLPALLSVGHPDGPVHHPTLHHTPVTVDLRQHRMIGLAGPRPKMLGLARFLMCQLVTLHGPSHVDIDVRTCAPATRGWESDWDSDWGWTRWLPRGRKIAIIDRDPASSGATAADDVETVVCLAESRAALPSACSAVVEWVTGPPSRLRLTTMGADRTRGHVVDGIVPDLVTSAWAQRCTRALAPLREATAAAAGALPESVTLADLLDIDPLDGEQVMRRWRERSHPPRAVVGVAADGPYAIDLRHDGPHLLVAGTTGAGKSELLRTLVASLAISCPPGDLAFLLVDYKGGAAFGECVQLPHVVGLVTDLDGHLTSRALTGLEAEIRRRERLLASARAADLDAYQRAREDSARESQADTLEALARLVIVIDEFGTLVDELPGFVEGLISVARRGRSLGIHLVLATQRPAGIVTGDIRANVAMRIALRVADPGDSSDVIGVPDAATLPSLLPGRAIARRAGGSIVRFQSAQVGRTGDPAGPRVSTLTPGSEPPPKPAAGPDVGQLATALASAADHLGLQPPSPPWQPPLPELVAVADLPGSGAHGPDSPYGVTIGLIDMPTEQRRDALRIDLGRGEHWLVAGTSGSGKTALLRTLLGQLAAHLDRVHVYIVEQAGGGLADAGALPHCGAVVGLDEPRRLDRLLQRLSEEVDDRRIRRVRSPRLLVLIDGWAAFADAADTIAHSRPLMTVQRLLRDGPPAGLTVIITGDRELLAARVGAYARHRLVLKLADPLDYAAAGIAQRAVPAHCPPGRGILAPTGHAVQVATPPDSLPQTAKPGGLEQRPFRVDRLPERINVDELSARFSPGWVLLGAGGDEIAPVGLELAGRLLVVAGARRSGRTTALRTIGRSVRECGGVAVPATSEKPPNVETDQAGFVVFVADDAESILGTAVDGWLLGTLREGCAGIVLAGMPETFARAYRGVAAAARQHPLLLLGPPTAADADLAGFPVSKEPHPTPVRGVLIVDRTNLDIQVALP